MTAERWRQVERLCPASLDREPGERAVFLTEACNGDDGLCREVESLLASEQSPNSVLDHPAWEGTERIIPGTKLGPYEIVSSIGKGGMGEVWKARDPRLNRDVAIKISDQQFSDRFEREARAIAALNHSN